MPLSRKEELDLWAGFFATCFWVAMFDANLLATLFAGAVGSIVSRMRWRKPAGPAVETHP